MGVMADEATFFEGRVQFPLALPRIVVTVETELGWCVLQEFGVLSAVGDRLVALGAVFDRIMDSDACPRIGDVMAPGAERVDFHAQEVRIGRCVRLVATRATMVNGAVSVRSSG
jgi:hypothetical protein